MPALIIVISDGAGSARSAEIGSRLAVTSMVEQAEAWLQTAPEVSALTREIFESWVEGVREQIADVAGVAEAEMRDYAATLLVAVLGPEHAAFGQIGDGAIVVLTGEFEWAWVFWPQHGQYVNTTHFVTDGDALKRLEFDTGPRTVREIAAFSDGLEGLVLDNKSRSAHQPFFNRIVAPLRGSKETGWDEKLSKHLEAYLSSGTVSSKTNDDVTLVIASRLDASAILLAQASKAVENINESVG